MDTKVLFEALNTELAKENIDLFKNMVQITCFDKETYD